MKVLNKVAVVLSTMILAACAPAYAGTTGTKGVTITPKAALIDVVEGKDVKDASGYGVAVGYNFKKGQIELDYLRDSHKAQTNHQTTLNYIHPISDVVGVVGGVGYTKGYDTPVVQYGVDVKLPTKGKLVPKARITHVHHTESKVREVQATAGVEIKF